MINDPIVTAPSDLSMWKYAKYPNTAPTDNPRISINHRTLPKFFVLKISTNINVNSSNTKAGKLDLITSANPNGSVKVPTMNNSN